MTNVPCLSFSLPDHCQRRGSGTMQHKQAASSHPPHGHSFMCLCGIDIMLLTMLGPAVVVASSWEWISVVASKTWWWHGDPGSCGGG